jgi:hypothetical protein
MAKTIQVSVRINKVVKIILIHMKIYIFVFLDHLSDTAPPIIEPMAEVIGKSATIRPI